MPEQNWWDADEVVSAASGGAKYGPPPKAAAPASLEELARLDLSRKNANLDERKFKYQQEQDAKKANGTAGMSRTQVGQARMKLNSLRGLEAQLARVEAADKGLNEDGWAGPIWGRVPGTSNFDPESGRYDKALDQLGTLVRQITRTPGEGAMSDYESKLAAAVLPSRSDSRTKRDEALAGLRELINVTRSGYQEMLGVEPAEAPAATGGGWGRARVVK